MLEELDLQEMIADDNLQPQNMNETNKSSIPDKNQTTQSWNMPLYDEGKFHNKSIEEDSVISSDSSFR